MPAHAAPAARRALGLAIVRRAPSPLLPPLGADVEVEGEGDHGGNALVPGRPIGGHGRVRVRLGVSGVELLVAENHLPCLDPLLGLGVRLGRGSVGARRCAKGHRVASRGGVEPVILGRLVGVGVRFERSVR